jgi:hypothetical protein
MALGAFHDVARHVGDFGMNSSRLFAAAASDSA